MTRVSRLVLMLCLVVLLHGCGMLGQNEIPPLRNADDPRHHTADSGIVMLAATWCGYCKRLRVAFDRAGVDYRVLDVDTEVGAKAMSSLKRRGVPVTIIGQRVIAGYDPDRIGELLLPLGYTLD